MRQGNVILDDGSEAIYIQVARSLKDRLRKGALQDNGRLPSYRVLAEEFGVSIGVMQRAMGLLRSESLIKVHHGKGVRVVPGQRFEPEMLKFGVIHPFEPRFAFGRTLSFAVGSAFESNHCEAMLTIRSSEGDAGLERRYADALVYNGVRGILLSPENGSANAAYFMELSRRVPIMQIDQVLQGVDLPGVIFDYRTAGVEIGNELRSRKCANTLLLLDTNSNRSIEELIEGMAGTMKNLRRLNLPLFKALRMMEQGDFSLFDRNAAELRRILEEEIDAIFCPFDIQLDLLFMETVPEEIRRRIVPAVLRGTVPERHSRTYCRSEVLEWELSHERLMELAVERLLKWCRNGQRPSGVRKIKLERLGSEATAGDGSR